MNNRLFILFVLIELFVVQINAFNAVDLVVNKIKNKVIRSNDTEQQTVSCITADGDEGICSKIESCNVTSQSRRERFINCGSVLRGTLDQICCPKNEKLNETILNSFSNELNCGRHFDFWDVVGGSEVPAHYDSWIVAIYQVVHFPATSAFNFSSQQFYRFICGGTLISKQHVISAAHCVVHGFRTLKAEDFLIKVGASNIDSTGTFHKVENVWAHENYRSYQRYNDISMFKLLTPVRKEYSLAACLPININSELREGTPLSVAGWGTTSFLGKLSQNLREAKLNYINNEECSRNYTRLEGSTVAYPNGIDSSMICAGNRLGGVDSCQGDSGGPLMYTSKTGQVYLVGIVSFGYKCAAPGYPGIYTRTYTYLNWILQTMRR